MIRNRCYKSKLLFKTSSLTFILCLTLLINNYSILNAFEIKGKITFDNNPIISATVLIENLKIGDKTDKNGEYSIKSELKNNQIDKLILQIRYIGYKTLIDTININEFNNNNLIKNYELKEDLLSTESVVVSATKNEIPIYETPIIVSRIDNKIFQNTQSVSVSEGLNFSPGLRVENNCQNCGFTQVRMNGLDGPYTQILINSRPIFSALTGIYGLEMLPANMIDRIEVVRGGGSSLFGGSAIAGTVNILTKDPIENTYDISFQNSFTNLNTPDKVINLNAAVVSDDLKKGFLIYGFNRNREPFDVNGDGFSELTKINNSTIGFDVFYNFTSTQKLKISNYLINEERRGGNKFELEPHFSDITERLIHKIIGFSASYEQYSDDLLEKFAIYTSYQTTKRDSYYGGGGRVLSENDTLTSQDILALNAYGKTNDYVINFGLQYSNQLLDNLNLTLGSDYTQNNVNDHMPGYNRKIDQNVKTFGNYFQFQFDLNSDLTFLIGSRLDYINIVGDYDFYIANYQNNVDFLNFVPRLSIMYNLIEEENQKLKFRTSYAQGYRTPQAFDEDLHLETVGGAAKFTFIDKNLNPETSNSYSISLNYLDLGEKNQFNLTIEGFLTELKNPFITGNQVELPNGIAIVTKRNGFGAIVMGSNIELSYAFTKAFSLQLGTTIQTAKYKQDETIWEPQVLNSNNIDSVIKTKNNLRTPNEYGYLNLNYKVLNDLSLSLSSVYTGSMIVPHVVDIDNEYTILKSTKEFLEFNFKTAYEYFIEDHNRIEISLGCQNILNSYQSDFDFGKNRDAGFIYGPNRPRTVFFSIKYGLI